MSKPRRPVPGLPADVPRCVKRPQVELLARLRDHCSLLREYRTRLGRGQHRFLGEVAGKLRLLVCEQGHRGRPLLLGLMEEKRYRQDVIVEQTVKPFGTYLSETVVQWSDSVSLPDGSLQVVEPGYLSRHDLVKVCAEQYGAAHEDWEWDPRLRSYLNYDRDHLVGELCKTADVVVSVAVDFLRAVQPEEKELSSDENQA